MANETLTNIFSDIADAVRAKGVTGQMTPLQMPAKITSIPSGGETPEAEWKDVNFIDYDGKNLYSYTTAEALALTALPPAPDRTSKGLTFQEWNYTLAQVKAEANDTGKCTAGATYTTTDGKTHIKITIQDEYYSNIPLNFWQSVSQGVEVDWGDGSVPETYNDSGTKTISHQYEPASYPASYEITFKVNRGMMCLEAIMGKDGTESSSNPKSAWNSMINEVNIGNNVTRLSDSAFSYCYSLASITIPSSVTEIVNSAFNKCHSLASITIPSGVNRILGGTFQSCYSLASISIPSSITGIYGSAFENCYSLASITIPSSVTEISQFQTCYSLASVTIPSSVTSIMNNMFENCSTLTSVTIPSSVTSIGSSAFYNCYGLVKLDCSTCAQVPTLSSTDAFDGTNTNLKIIVPDALYDDWTVASNWSTYASKIVKASEA